MLQVLNHISILIRTIFLVNGIGEIFQISIIFLVQEINTYQHIVGAVGLFQQQVL